MKKRKGQLSKGILADARLRIKLNKGQKDIDDAKKAAEKLNNSVSKRIEEIAIHEMPDRYLSSGLQNWALLIKQRRSDTTETSKRKTPFKRKRSKTS